MHPLSDALSALPDAVFADLLESEAAYLLVLDVPGVGPEDVDVTVAAHKLEIDAHRRKSVPPEFEYVTEDRSVFLDASLPLPPDASATDAEATVRGGVLEVRLPKVAATPTTVPVAGE